VSQPSKTKSAGNQVETRRIAALAKQAGRLAKENRKKGYH